MADEKKVVLTQEGYDKLQEKLNYLQTIRRDEIAQQIAVARGFGDLSENAEYDEARKDQARNETEILKLISQLENCEIVKESEMNTEAIGVGNRVLLKNLKTGAEMTVSIVSANETDARAMKISTDSPIGGGLQGHKVGDIVEISVPSGVLELQVQEITLL